MEVLDDSITVPMDTDITGEIGEGVAYDQSYYTKSTLDDDLELSGDERTYICTDVFLFLIG